MNAIECIECIMQRNAITRKMHRMHMQRNAITRKMHRMLQCSCNAGDACECRKCTAWAKTTHAFLGKNHTFPGDRHAATCHVLLREGPYCPRIVQSTRGVRYQGCSAVCRSTRCCSVSKTASPATMECREAPLAVRVNAAAAAFREMYAHMFYQPGGRGAQKACESFQEGCESCGRPLLFQSPVAG